MDGLYNTCRLVLYREDGEIVNDMAARILPANFFHFYIQITSFPKPYLNARGMRATTFSTENYSGF
ncbi:MAG: hypothetical protein ABJA60_05915 [Nitrosospira sp.]